MYFDDVDTANFDNIGAVEKVEYSAVMVGR